MIDNDLDNRYYALAENFTPAINISGGSGQGTSGNGGNTYIPNMTNDMSGYMNNLAGIVGNILGGLSAEYAQGLFLSGGKGQINSTGNSSTNGLGVGGSQVLYAQVPYQQLGEDFLQKMREKKKFFWNDILNSIK